MNFLEKQLHKDFGSQFSITSYVPQFEKSGEWVGKLHLVFSIKNYNQFSAITVDKVGEEIFKMTDILMILDDYDGKSFKMNFWNKENEKFENIPHTRNVYLYCNELLVDKDLLVKFFFEKKLRLHIRDKNYFNMEKPDFFISHDSNDKEEVARPLFDELVKRGYKVWYDEFSLKIGDSLVDSIDEGIRTCKKGIIILSPNFLSNESWAKSELQAIRVKHIQKGNIILPIWHNISASDLEEQYWLLNIFGGNTNNGIENLVNQIEKSLN